MAEVIWPAFIALGAALNIAALVWHVVYYWRFGTLNATSRQIRSNTAVDGIMVVMLTWAATTALNAHDGWVLLFAAIGLVAAVADAWCVLILGRS